MNCPTCGERTRLIKVHDENPFYYNECSSCGWDDYDENARFNQEMKVLERESMLDLDDTNDPYNIGFSDED